MRVKGETAKEAEAEEDKQKQGKHKERIRSWDQSCRDEAEKH